MTNFHQRSFIILTILILKVNLLSAQKTIRTITSGSDKAWISDGKNVKMDWHLEPGAKPDIYYVNIPSQKSIIKFKTDQNQLTIRTQPGKKYDFLVLLNGKDSCHIRIASVLPPDLPEFSASPDYPVHIPFKLINSKIYFDGQVNGKSVLIQLDLGAGTSVVNKNSSGKIGLEFSSNTIVSNTNGINKEKTSLHNILKINTLAWKETSLTEVGNMKPFEDIIIGNGFFRDKIIGIDYDKNELVIYGKLPEEAGQYTKNSVFYVQDRPMFRVKFIHNQKKFDFWFLFDTGRDGSMMIGNDFTQSGSNWEHLHPLTTINGRKIIRLDAFIAGLEFKDIVTNASDPSVPNGKASLFGNQILKHFNVILDNRTGTLYLKPNSLINEPYFNYQSYLKEMDGKSDQK